MKALYIKLWPEILSDPKMGRLTDSAFRRCIQLFLLGNDDPKRDGSLPNIQDIAWTLRVDEAVLVHDLEELFQAGIISWVDGGKPFIVNFAKRQAAVTPAERKRISRARKAKELMNSPEVGHGVVTSESQVSHEGVTKRDLREGNVREEKGREEKGRESAPESAALPSPPPSSSQNSKLKFQKYQIAEWGFGPNLEKYWSVIEAMQLCCNVPKQDTFCEDIYTVIGWGTDGPSAADVEDLAKEIRGKPDFDGMVWPKNIFALHDAKLKNPESPTWEPKQYSDQELAEIDANSMAELQRHGLLEVES